jgi:hypothetical protein
MHGLISEEESFGANPGTKDLVRHMFTRMSCGKIVIVSDRPEALLGPLRKQWMKLARKVQKERSSTLNGSRLFELNQMIQRMYTVRFTTKWPDDYLADIYITNSERLLHWAPECRTIYITCNVSLEEQYIITALMPRNGLMVMCNMARHRLLS